MTPIPAILASSAAIRVTVAKSPAREVQLLIVPGDADAFVLRNGLQLRQDEQYFGGLREKVLQRDSYPCRVCDASAATSGRSSGAGVVGPAYDDLALPTLP